MVFEFKLPDIGEGVHEGEIVSWKIKEGDSVKENQPIVEVMTDKATVEITSPRTGRIAGLLAKEGQVVKVGDVILRIDDSAAGTGTKPAATAGPAAAKPAAPIASATPTAAPPKAEAAKEEKTLFDLPSEIGGRRKPRPQAPSAATTTPAPASAAPSAGSTSTLSTPRTNGKTLAAPAVRRRARELGLDLTNVPGTGPGGRVRKEDIVTFATKAPPAASAGGAAVGSTAASPTGHAGDERVPIRGLRKAIFENMRRSEDFAVPFTYWDSFDVTDLVKLRRDAGSLAEQQGVKLTYLPFLVKAVVAGLKLHPHLNAVMDENTRELVVRHTYDIGIATATDAGLMVVIVRNADKKSIFEIARDIETLSEKAKAGKASREELTGGTFTITSLGKDGGLGATPVINHPEVAILGVHKIEARAVVDSDRKVVVRDMMNLSATFDHRVIDGHIGARFLQEVGKLLSQPNLLLLGTA
ncbi:MAG: dihydrolipoamide acetyltransferase family protein [Thermoplasmatota archaeon]